MSKANTLLYEYIKKFLDIMGGLCYHPNTFLLLENISILTKKETDY